MKITAIIPARYSSTRFPGKPLAEIAGYPMIQHVYCRVKSCAELDGVIVATDDKRIYNTVRNFGGKVVMTGSGHSSGTDRIAEVAADLNSDLIVNVQGDEPLIKPEMISAAVQPFYGAEKPVMSTLRKKIEEREDIENPDAVKVVTDKNGYALYFSRRPIPYCRNEVQGISQGASGSRDSGGYYKHIGLYVYERNFLLNYSRMEPTPLEEAESLEQLRALENGYRIRVVETEYDSIGVDRPRDIEKVEDIIDRGEIKVFKKRSGSQKGEK